MKQRQREATTTAPAGARKVGKAQGRNREREAWPAGQRLIKKSVQ